jgi:thiol-disulfide isomerase/thioredoxin
MNGPPPSPASSAPATRRRWLAIGGAGALAALGGAGLAFWRLRSGPGDDAARALWAASFESPAGGAAVRMAAFRGNPLLLNFWATWCAPCLEELPRLNRFYADHRAQGWQVLGLAIDQAASVRKFVQRQPLDFPLALGGLAGADIGRALGNGEGGLPFSVLFGANGGIARRKMGQLTEQNLREWLLAA